MTGVSLSHTDGVMGAVITAQKALADADALLNLNTPHLLSAPYSEGSAPCLLSEEAVRRVEAGRGAVCGGVPVRGWRPGAGGAVRRIGRGGRVGAMRRSRDTYEERKLPGRCYWCGHARDAHQGTALECPNLSPQAASVAHPAIGSVVEGDGERTPLRLEYGDGNESWFPAGRTAPL